MKVETVVHGSTVAVAGRGLLIIGRSGAGKSSLALELMARGAALVSDDRTELWRSEGQVWARAPRTIAGLIEARGIGLLRAEHVAAVPLRALVDLDRVESERLPRHLDVEVLPGLMLPRLSRVEGPAFAAALIQYLRGGVCDPDAPVARN